MKATPGDIDMIRNAMSYFWTTADMIQNKPQLVAIDIPGAGVGLEGSIHKLYGTIRIGDLIISVPSTETAPSGIKRGSM